MATTSFASQSFLLFNLAIFILSAHEQCMLLCAKGLGVKKFWVALTWSLADVNVIFHHPLHEWRPMFSSCTASIWVLDNCLCWWQNMQIYHNGRSNDVRQVFHDSSAQVVLGSQPSISKQQCESQYLWTKWSTLSNDQDYHWERRTPWGLWFLTIGSLPLDGFMLYDISRFPIQL